MKIGHQMAKLVIYDSSPLVRMELVHALSSLIYKQSTLKGITNDESLPTIGMNTHKM